VARLVLHSPSPILPVGGEVQAVQRATVAQHDTRLETQAANDTTKFYVLAVHLLILICAQAEKQSKQREATGTRATALLSREPGATVVIAGDTNNSDRTFLYGIGAVAEELNRFVATHHTNKCYHRLVSRRGQEMGGDGVLWPPYGPRPNNANKRVWREHYFVGGGDASGVSELSQYHWFCGHLVSRSSVRSPKLQSAGLPRRPRPYENPDGSPLRVATVYHGKRRDESNPTPGPFEKPGGGSLLIKVH
jgi:hypothetical protein